MGGSCGTEDSRDNKDALLDSEAGKAPPSRMSMCGPVCGGPGGSQEVILEATTGPVPSRALQFQTIRHSSTRHDTSQHSNTIHHRNKPVGSSRHSFDSVGHVQERMLWCARSVCLCLYSASTTRIRCFELVVSEEACCREAETERPMQ